MLLNLVLQQVLKHHPPIFFLVGWVGAVPHPLPGVPLTFQSDISYGDPWKIIINFSNANANANANPSANANANGSF